MIGTGNLDNKIKKALRDKPIAPLLMCEYSIGRILCQPSKININFIKFILFSLFFTVIFYRTIAGLGAVKRRRYCFPCRLTCPFS